LGSLFVSPFVFGALLLGKLLNLPAVLEVVALGTVNLAVLLAGSFWLVGSRQGLTRDTPGKLLAGVVSLGLLGGVGLAETFDGKQPLRFLLFFRFPFFAGAGTSSLSESTPAPAFSPGSLLPSSARAHLSAKA